MLTIGNKMPIFCTAGQERNIITNEQLIGIFFNNKLSRHHNGGLYFPKTLIFSC